nr:phosphotransferase [Geodermatophilaceae bacterium]
MDEERLPGGNVGGAWRVGETVRRTPGPWTPAVHALLAHLDGRLRGVPRVHGFDSRGREVLDFLPGCIVDVDSEVLTDAQLASMVRWTRELHMAVADFAHAGPWRFFPVDAPSLIGHNDIAPYNAVFDGDELVGVFDWDFAGPSTPLLELAFIAWNGVPMWADIGTALAAHRLELIAGQYGGPSAGAILAALPGRIQLMLDGIPLAAAAGDAGMAALVAAGEPERSRTALDELVLRMPAVAALLTWVDGPSRRHRGGLA